jgi:hypothetical protein
MFRRSEAEKHMKSPATAGTPVSCTGSGAALNAQHFAFSFFIFAFLVLSAFSLRVVGWRTLSNEVFQ